MIIPHFMYPFIGWWTFELFCFHLLNIITNVAMSLCVQVFEWPYIFISLEDIPSNRILGCWGFSSCLTTKFMFLKHVPRRLLQANKLTVFFFSGLFLFMLHNEKSQDSGLKTWGEASEILLAFSSAQISYTHSSVENGVMCIFGKQKSSQCFINQNDHVTTQVSISGKCKVFFS